MRCELRCECVCILKKPDFSETMFPKTRERLSKTEYKEALLRVARAKDVDRYANLIDFMFCEIFVSPWQKRCFKYYKYRDKRDRLVSMFNKTEFEFYDNLLCNLVLEVCKRLATLNKEVSWEEMRKQIFGIIKLQKRR